MPDHQCIKTYYQKTMMPNVPQSMAFYDGQAPGAGVEHPIPNIEIHGETGPEK